MTRPRRILVALAAAAALVVLGLWSWPRTRVTPAEARYVGRASCARCHAAQAAGFAGSDHDRAMDAASEATVLGRFDGSTLEHHGIVSTMFRDGDRFVVRTQGRDGKLADFTVSHVFGADPLQQYLVDFEDGRRQCLPIAWDVAEQRWFHLYPDDAFPPGDSLHWTGRDQNWNWMCAECHGTGVVRGYDEAHDRYATTAAEWDVSCEACHGPGSAHVDWAEGSALARLLVADRGLVADLARQGPQLEVCARCHSRRGPLTASSHAGEGFHDSYRLALLDTGLYEADGTIRDEVFEYGSFLQSRMHREGVRCTDCHDPHAGTLLASGNALCVRCHDATRYDLPAHHHHTPGSAGAACVACHMPQRTYMRVDERRDHSFRVPRPDLGVAHGTRNACNDCHRDRGVDWAAAATAAWRGGRPPYESPFTRQGTWTAAFAARAHGGGDAAARLRALAADREQPGIIRASALEQLGGDVVHDGVALADLALDPDPLVRAAVARAGRALDGEARLALLAPLLDDAVRVVRIDAARSLVAGREHALPEALRESFERAFAELEASLAASADRPETMVTRGAIREERGDHAGAEAAYRRAIALDPASVPPRLDLAVLLDATGRGAEAVEHLRAAVVAAPAFAPARYNLALALAAIDGQEGEALAQLEIAAEGMPDHARLFYNLGLLRQRAGDATGARAALLRARELAPEDPDVTAALAALGR